MKTRSIFLHGLASILIAAAVGVLMGPSPAAAVAVEWRISSDPPSIVYVDDDFTPDTIGWGVDHFATIQAGVDAVAPAGTVMVAEGTYSGQITIYKDLELQGDAKTSVLQAVEGMPFCTTNPEGELRSVICIQGNVSARIQGFTIAWGGSGIPDSGFAGVAFSDQAGTGDASESTIEIVENRLVYPESWILTNQGSAGIEIDVGYRSGHKGFFISQNEIIGFDFGIRFHQCNPFYGETCVEGASSQHDVLSNNLFNNNVAIALGEGVDGESQIHYNRIHNDATLNGIGLSAAPWVLVNAENNWWGCNDVIVPTFGCSSLDIALGAEVDFEPWLVLTLEQPPATPVGETIPISADLIHSWYNDDTSSGGTVMDGIEIQFSATRGTFEFERAGTLGGVAANAYTAPADTGPDSICASLDASGQICTEIMVIPEPLEVTSLDLLASTDQVNWQQIQGSLLDGFDLGLDPMVEFYYLDAANVAANRPLKDGKHPFYFHEFPGGFFSFISPSISGTKKRLRSIDLGRFNHVTDRHINMW